MLAEEKGLGFRLTLDDAAPGWRYGDEVRLRQILSNLISNALKFTEAGDIAVEIAGDEDGVIVKVSDTGPGIAPDDQAHVFDRFVQADGSNTRRAGGTGLGLAICKELAGLMGGRISLASAVGAGACFTLRLPLPARPLSPAQAAGEAQSSSSLGAGLQVLVVDDNATNRFVLQTLLAEFGLESDMAHDGLEAVSAWQDHDYDAILMDVRMPNMDGLDATRAIRAGECRQNRARTPIIAVTASVLSHEAAAYRAAGMDDVVGKPVTPVCCWRRSVVNCPWPPSPATMPRTRPSGPSQSIPRASRWLSGCGFCSHSWTRGDSWRYEATIHNDCPSSE